MAGIIKAIKKYYKPTENQKLKHFHFRTITQLTDETFQRFCNRVEAEAKHCNFNCDSENCSAEKQLFAIKFSLALATMTYTMKP